MARFVPAAAPAEQHAVALRLGRRLAGGRAGRSVPTSQASFGGATVVLAGRGSRRMSGGPSPLVSVVVPTRDRPDQLARLPRRARAPRRPPAYEIVVVDDALADPAAVARRGRRGAARAPGARRRPRPGRGPQPGRGAGAGAGRLLHRRRLPARARLARRDRRLASTARAEPRRGRRADAHGRDAATCSPSPPRSITNHLAGEFAGPRPAGRLGFAPTSNLACRAERAARRAVRRALPARRRRGPRLVRAARRRRADGSCSSRRPASGTTRTSRPDGFWRQQLRYGRGAYRFHRRHQGLGRPRRRFYVGLLARRVSARASCRPPRPARAGRHRRGPDGGGAVGLAGVPRRTDRAGQRTSSGSPDHAGDVDARPARRRWRRCPRGGAGGSA